MTMQVSQTRTTHTGRIKERVKSICSKLTPPVSTRRIIARGHVDPLLSMLAYSFSAPAALLHFHASDLLDH